jgi:tetratricopeptide (TPR) repeat protein
VPIALPGPDVLPAGPRRDLVVALHELYRQAGKPATRIISRKITTDRDLETVSHETISSVLRGRSVPSWNKLRSIVVALCRMSVNQLDIRQQVVDFNALWNRADAPASMSPGSGRAFGVMAPIPEFDSPAPVRQRPVEPFALRVHGELPERSRLFSGRENVLDEMERRLSRSPEIPLILYGVLGAGKSQVAAEYVRQHRGDYAITWWVRAATLQQARESLMRLAERLGVAAGGHGRHPFEVLFDLLARSGPCLLVFDGVVSGDIRTLIRTRGGNVIVTTRNANWAQEGAHESLEVPDLDDSEAARLLRKHDPRITPSQVAALTEVVGRAPLGLAEVCRLHRELGVSWEQLAGRLGDAADRVLTGSRRVSRRTVGTVRSVLEERLAAERNLLPLLTLLLGFGPSPVWLWMLRRGADGDISPAARHVLADQAELRRSLHLLAGAGLIRRPAGGEWVQVPALLRLVLRELLPVACGEVNRRDVVEILLRADPAQPENPQTGTRHRAITPHVRPAGLLHSFRPAVYRTVHHQIRFLFLSGQLKAAQRLGREAEQALSQQDALSPADGVVLLIGRDLASALRADGEYAQAYRLTERALALAGDTGEIALDLARSRGHDLRIAGRYQEAFELDDSTQQRHLAVFGENDLRYLATRRNLSLSRRFLGLYREAAEADRADLDRMRTGDGQRRARVTNALAEDLYGLGRFEEVVDLLAPLLEVGSGRELERARRMTGVALRRLGRPGPAVEQLGACYQVCLEQFGARSDLTLAVCVSLGNALRARGQYDTALHYCGLASAGYAAAMGPDNPLVHVAATNAAAVHLAQGAAARAVEILEPAHEALAESVGERHPFTVLAGVNRAFAAAATEPERAWSWPREAYEQAREVFGADHLDTLSAGAGWAAHDDEDDMVPGPDQILGVLRRRFGAGHELVSRVASGLAMVVEIEVPTA